MGCDNSDYSNNNFGPDHSSYSNVRPAFQHLRHVVVGSNVKAIPNGAFKDSKITSIVIPNSVKYIGAGAFMRCDSLTSITLGTGVDTISNYAFYKCTNLTGIALPSSLKHIDTRAFEYCGLTSLTIPENVGSIGEYIVGHTSSLDAIYSLATVPPAISQNTFRSTSGTQPYTKPIYVSCTALESYRNSNH